MFSRHYQGYALVGLILIGWSALIDWRNLNNPRVQHVTVDRDGLHNVVKGGIWNPRDEDMYVKALVRLINPGDFGSGRSLSASPYNIVKGRIAPRSSLPIHERVNAYGAWPEAEVRVFVINDPAEIEAIAQAGAFTTPAVE